MVERACFINNNKPLMCKHGGDVVSRHNRLRNVPIESFDGLVWVLMLKQEVVWGM